MGDQEIMSIWNQTFHMTFWDTPGHNETFDPPPLFLKWIESH